MNIHPSDGHNFGFGVPSWINADDVGNAASPLSADFKSGAQWQTHPQYIAIVRHNGVACEAAKVWQFLDASLSLTDRFQTYPRSVLAAPATSGPVYEYVPEDLAGRTADPIFGIDGQIIFNHVYANNGARILLDGQTLSCRTCNTDDDHGLGNEFGANTDAGRGSAAWTHDVGAIQGPCH